MRVFTPFLLLAVVVIADCNNVFLGIKPIEYHFNLEYNAIAFRHRVENFYFTLPAAAANAGRHIQGIRAYDLTDSGASMNVMQGGTGFNFVNLRMTSDLGRRLHYDVYIYA